VISNGDGLFCPVDDIEVKNSIPIANQNAARWAAFDVDQQWQTELSVSSRHANLAKYQAH
jgi:hypothetical protein